MKLRNFSELAIFFFFNGLIISIIPAIVNSVMTIFTEALYINFSNILISSANLMVFPAFFLSALYSYLAIMPARSKSQGPLNKVVLGLIFVSSASILYIKFTQLFQ